MTELYLVRHAQASFSSDDYDNLSDLGVRQSQRLGAFFATQEICFDAVMTGTMHRHTQTLDEVLRAMQSSNGLRREVHGGFDEYPFRTLLRLFAEAHPAHDLVRDFHARPADRRSFFRLLRHVLTAWSEGRIEGAPETWAAFQARVMAAREYLHEFRESCQRILVISSGGAISYFAGSVLNLAPQHVFDLNLQVRNTSITRLFLGRNGFRLAEFNSLPQLADKAYAAYVTYS